MTANLRLHAASSVEPAATRWLWARRIPLGTVTLLAGREGEGKSTLTNALGAELTRGELLGDVDGPAAVIFASAEDSPSSTIVPRLMAAGADLGRVHLLDVSLDERDGRVPDALTLPRDTRALGDAVAHVGARLLVLDPLVSYLDGQVNAHRDQHVRRVLAPLAKMAAEHDVAVVSVIHLNKGDTVDALARVSGSVGFTAAARSVLLFARDPHDPEGDTGTRRVIAHAKCNVGRKQPSIQARVEQRVVEASPGGPYIETSRLVLLGETDQNASDLLGPPSSEEDRTALEDAVAFLRDELADGPRTANQIKAAAQDAGVAERTLARAKGPAGVKSRKLPDGWVWTLNGATVPPSGDVGALGSLDASKSANNAKNANGGIKGQPSLSLVPDDLGAAA